MISEERDILHSNEECSRERRMWIIVIMKDLHALTHLYFNVLTVLVLESWRITYLGDYKHNKLESAAVMNIFTTFFVSLCSQDQTRLPTSRASKRQRQRLWGRVYRAIFR